MIPSWHQYFMNLASVAAERSSCLSRQVGTAIIQDKRVIALGYNGVPSGVEHCKACDRVSGVDLWSCRALHSEENAIISCAIYGISTKGGILYTTLQPCYHCAKMILQAGITEVIYKDNYSGDQKGIEFLRNNHILVFKLSELMEV
jgi:dCMP deaminase